MDALILGRRFHMNEGAFHPHVIKFMDNGLKR